MKSNSKARGNAIIVTIESLNFTIKRGRIDNKSVSLCAQFMQVCQDKQIIVERKVPYSLWQLARFEMHWKTLSEGAKTLLVTADLPDKFWGHAFMTMVYIRNRTWSTEAHGIP